MGRAETDEPVAGIFAKSRVRLPKNVATPRGRLALANVVKPFPRVVRPQALSHPAYQQAVAGLLRTKGLRLDKARLTQHWRVDLNGDGIEEVLLTAHAHSKMGTNVYLGQGDYSVIALRFLDKRTGKVKLVPLDIQTKPSSKQDTTSLAFNALGCPDLNGDGKQEIVFDYRYYEGGGIEAWSFDGSTLKRVASGGWGV